MKLNPGHYVALLLTTTLYSPTAAAVTSVNDKNTPLRITKIKLLRPTDTLALGHVYRLVPSKEVMKGLWAKKQAKLKLEGADKIEKLTPQFETEVKQEKQRSRNNTAVSRSRGWQPSLKAISEAGS